jgi:hypothetical protein
MAMPPFADRANLVVEKYQEPEVEEGPEGETSLQLLQTVYRDRSQPLNVRVRCAVEALAHEYPRVSAVAVTSMGGQSFADALERAIERSGTKPPLLPTPKVIEHEPPELPASDLKGPFANYRNNYRRY